MVEVTGLIMIALTLLLRGTGALELGRGHCTETQCFSVFQEPSDFSAAQTHCEELGGHLMTVRSSVSHDILSVLMGSYAGRFWIGLHLPAGCPDATTELRGFQWVSPDSEGDFFHWALDFDSSCSSPRCVSISMEDDSRWTQDACAEQRAGFLCEHRIKEPCKSLVTAEDESVTYSTHLGFQGKDLPVLPPGSTAIRMPAETKYICFAEQWLRAPWSCEIARGGCEHKCAEDHGNQPSCYCPPGQTVNPANRVTCEEASEDPCLHLNCTQVCFRQGDTYTCACDGGFKLAPDGRSCVDVNDCTDERQCPGDNFKCENTLGGFRCVCEDGYKLTGGACVDVDECVSAPCEHLCTNTPGSYRCHCYDGYKEDSEAPYKCKLHCGEAECAAECDPNDLFQCYCPEGYISEERAGSTVCIDIDECAFFYCDQGCKNTFGGYICSCSRGYTLVGQYKCIKNDDDSDLEEGSEGSGTSTTPPTAPSVTHPHPTRQPSGVSPGGLAGIIVCTVFFIVLVVFGAHHLLCGRDEKKSAAALEAREGEARGSPQGTTGV
ncbi:thrombomodulin-like [Halichoeres trimaculatus]|uniref:thrombomodulin-like n=1 Tax=Halichoeres trimaculatus TaxID=147232 RepID=UPI003D9F7A0D